MVIVLALRPPLPGHGCRTRSIHSLKYLWEELLAVYREKTESRQEDLPLVASPRVPYASFVVGQTQVTHFGRSAQRKLSPSERRDSVRYELHAPVIFSWEIAGGSRRSGEGETRDLSEIGSYVRTTTCPEVGSSVEIQVFLFAEPGAPTASLIGKMKVVRVDEGRHQFGGFGFALTGGAFTLSDSAR